MWNCLLLSNVFGCCIYVLLLLNMPEMTHDWINKKYSMGSTWFIQFNDYHVYLRISGCMIKKTVTSRITLGVSTYTLQML